MRFVLAALVLLFVQQLAWRTPDSLPGPSPAGHATKPNHDEALARARQANDPLSIASLLDGRNSTVDAVALSGRVVDASPTWGDGVRITVDVETADYRGAEGLVSVSLRQTSRRWRTGDRVSLRSRLRRITGFGNFGELDWSAYNARRGLFVSAYAWRDEDVEMLAPGDGFVDGLRRTFSEACERVGGQGAEILEALIIGDRTGIDRTTSVAVRDAGLAHFLAISGSHMALIVVLVVALVRRSAGLSITLLERVDVLRVAAVLAGLAVIAYGAVCGGGVSVARSVLMALAAMVALWRGRPGDDLRALGGSAIVLALVMPGVGEEAGFQLSYLAVAALIMDSRRRRAARREARREPAQNGAALPAAAPFAVTLRSASATAVQASEPAPEIAPVHPAPPSRAAKALEFLLEAGRITVICWLVTSPVVAHHFQRISLVAPLANLLAAPLVSAIVVSGLGGLLLLPAFPAAGELAVRFGALLSDLVVSISAWCASLPHAATVTPAPGIALTAVLTALALVMLLPSHGRWRRRAATALVMIAVLLIGHGLHERYRNDRLDIWFASVGQGDAAIVRMPGGKVWVIDQGPPGRGRMVVAPLLRRAWIGRIDVLVASHVQSDHCGAMAEILEEFDAGEIWLPDGPCTNDGGRALVREAQSRGVLVRYVSNVGTSAEAAERAVPGGSAGIDVLWPPPAAASCNDNDQSIVIALSFAGRRVLFTGDIEAAGEAGVVALADARADVLKVPHHGSRTSSSAMLLDEVMPSIAVASLGLDNQFRFPAPDVVARYVERAVRLLRTDQDGAVHLTIDADGKVDVETFHSGTMLTDVPARSMP